MTVEKTVEQPDDKDYEAVFEELGKKLNKIGLEKKEGIVAVNEEIEKKKSEAIIQSAIELKAIKVKERKPINTICKEMTNRMKGRVSSSLVRKCLGPEYKLRYRSENAKKRKTTKRLPIESGKSAVILPLNQSKKTKQEIACNDMSSFVLEKEQRLDHVKKPLQKDISVIDLNLVNPKQELALDKLHDECVNAVRPASKIKETVKDLTNQDDAGSDQIGQSEFPIEIQTIQRYMTPCYPILGDHGKIWFHIKFDRKTGSVISAGLGRLNKDENKDRNESEELGGNISDS